MSFDFSTLITNRTAQDVQTLLDLYNSGQWTAEQIAAFNLAASRGAYNYTDLNRVTACMEYLDSVLSELGYSTGYVQVEIHPQNPNPAPVLPDGYTQLEYIQSSGTQYIDTGIKPNQNTRAVADLEITSQTSPIVGVMGVRDQSSASAAQKFILWSMDTGNTARSDWFGTYANVSSPIDMVGSCLKIDKNKAVCKVGNTTLTNTLATGQCANPLYIFCVNDGVTGANYFGNIKLYGFQMYNNETCILDCTPCKNPSGEIGLYDFIGGVFYSNAGTGEFVSGPEIPTPEPDPVLDPYTWYESDVPTPNQMAQYLLNVSNLCAVFIENPQLPSDMSNLTFTGANQIEQALLAVNSFVSRIYASWFYSGEIYSGEAQA